MQKVEQFSVDESGWIHCPCCKCRTRTKVKPETVVKNFPVYCPKCKREYIVDVEALQIKLSVEPKSR